MRSRKASGGRDRDHVEERPRARRRACRRWRSCACARRAGTRRPSRAWRATGTGSRRARPTRRAARGRRSAPDDAGEQHDDLGDDQERRRELNQRDEDGARAEPPSWRREPAGSSSARPASRFGDVRHRRYASLPETFSRSPGLIAELALPLRVEARLAERLAEGSRSTSMNCRPLPVRSWRSDSLSLRCRPAGQPRSGRIRA